MRSSKYIWSESQIEEAKTRLVATVEQGASYDYTRACTIKSARYGGSVRPKTSVVWAVRLLGSGIIRTWAGICDSWQACNGLRQLPADMHQAVMAYRKEAGK